MKCVAGALAALQNFPFKNFSLYKAYLFVAVYILFVNNCGLVSD